MQLLGDTAGFRLKRAEFAEAIQTKDESWGSTFGVRQIWIFSTPDRKPDSVFYLVLSAGQQVFQFDAWQFTSNASEGARLQITYVKSSEMTSYISRASSPYLWPRMSELLQFMLALCYCGRESFFFHEARHELSM